MDNNAKIEEPNAFPYDLSELGDIVNEEELTPGVYYVQVNPLDDEQDTEFYIVDQSADYISGMARTYGFPLESSVLAFSCNSLRGGKHVLQYEILHYKKNMGLEDDSGETLLSIAAFGREFYPEYFGPYSAPAVTPRGFTARYKELKNGLFVLETDQYEKMLAVCFPIADTAFTDFTMQFAEMTDFDRVNGIENTYGYVFFPQKAMSLSLFELILEFRELHNSKLLNIPALYNAVWKEYPEYAAIHNHNEQNGLNDVIGVILTELGFPVELNVSPDNLIPLVADAGTDYLRF